MNSKIILFFLNTKHLNHYIFIPILLLYFANFFLELKYSKRKSNLKSDSSFERRMTFYTVFVIIATLILLRNIPFIRKVIDIINYSFLIYILIVVPLFNKKIFYNFIEDNTTISLFLFMELYNIISKFKIIYLSSLSNQILLQALIILIIFSIIFLTIYIFLINIKFVLYYLSIYVFKPINDNLFKLITLLNKKFNKNIINEIITFKKFKFKSLMVSTANLILFTLFIIVIRSLLSVLLYFFEIFTNFFGNVDNRSLHKISKIAIISTIFSLYLIIQISHTFDSTIISSYEFISSTIVIPLLLEGFLTKSNEI